MRLRRKKHTTNRDVAQAGVVNYGSKHLWAFLPPWAAWGSLPVVGTLTHAMAGVSVPGAVAVGSVMALGSFALTAFTHHVYKARAESIRLQATVTVGAAAVWSLWTTASGLWQTTAGHGWNVFGWIFGVFNPWPWGAWALVGPFFCAAWNIRRLSRTETDKQTDGSGLFDKVRVAGRVRSAELEGNDSRVRAEIEVTRGQHTIGDVQEQIGNIASALGVRRTAIRVIENPDDAARGTLLVTPRDLLAETKHWPGPTAPGESIAEQINVGGYEDGETAHLWLPGDHDKQRNSCHIAISGMSGAGKTETGLSMLGDAMTRRDFSVVFSDPVKGLQSCAPLASGVGLLLTDQKSAVAGLRGLKVAITARTTQLGRYGFKQWTPKAALPVDKGGAELRMLVYWLEESAALIAESTSFVQLTEQARSAGIVLVLSQQRLTHDRIDTSARANLGAMWSFGIMRKEDAKFGLSEETLDAGAAPWTWRNTKPGCSYLEAAGIPTDRWAIPLRGYLTPADHLTQVVEEYADGTLDPTTAGAFGTLYTDYQRQVAEGKAIWQTGAQTVAIPVSGFSPAAELEETEAVHIDDQLDDGDEKEEHVDMPIPAQPEPGFMDDIDPSKDIEEDDDAPIEFPAPPARKAMGTKEARDALLHVLKKMATRGDADVRPAQLVEFRQYVGREAPWLTKELRRLARDEVVTIEAESGAYGLDRLREGELTGAGV